MTTKIILSPEEHEKSLIEKWKKEKQVLGNPFVSYPWFVQEPLEPEEELEAMQFERQVFNETRVTKGANPYAKTNMIEAQLAPDGHPIPNTIRKPDKMVKQIVKAYQQVVEHNKEQTQILKNITATLEKEKREKNKKKDAYVQNLELETEEDALSDPYSGTTPHLSEEEPESEDEKEEETLLYQCCNFDQMDELCVSSLFVEDEEEQHHSPPPRRNMENIRASLFENFNQEEEDFDPFYDPEVDPDFEQEHQEMRHPGFFDDYEEDYLPVKKDRTPKHQYPHRNRNDDFLSEDGDWNYEDEFLFPQEPDFDIMEEAPEYQKEVRPPKHKKEAEIFLDVPKERGSSLRKDLARLQEKHPGFFKTINETPDLLKSQGTHQTQTKPYKHQTLKEPGPKTKEFREDMKKERLRRKNLTSRERMALYFRDRYPIPSGLPTVESESVHPLDPNPLMSQFPWNLMAKVTKNFIESDVDIYMLKKQFIGHSYQSIFLALFFLTLLFMGSLFELPSALLTLLFGLVMVCIYHEASDICVKTKAYVREKKDRAYRLIAEKPIANSLGLIRNPGYYRRPKYPPEVDPSLFRDCHMISEDNQDEVNSTISTTPLIGDQQMKSKPKKRRELRERPKISEALVSLIDERPFIPVLLENGAQHIALLDTGSTSCAIKPEVLAKLEETMAVPRITKEYRLTGVIPGVTSKGTEVAFITITLNKGYTVKNIPMIVADCGADLLIGANLIRSHRWANYWDDDKYYIDIGKTGQTTEYDDKGKKKKKEPIQAYFLPKSVVKGITMCCMTLEPGERKIVSLKIPQLDELKETNFHQSDLMAMGIEEKDSKTPGLRVTPCVTRISKKKEILVEVSNKSSLPVFYEKGLEIARIQMIKLTDEKGETPSADITNLLQIKHVFDQIPRIHPITDECYCRAGEHPEDVSRVFIQLSDRYGLTSTADNLVTTIPRIGDTSEITPMTPLKPGLCIRKHFKNHLSKEEKPFYSILIVPDDNGEYQAITKQQMEEVKEMVLGYFKDRSYSPVFLFLDPLMDISYHSMKIITELFLVFDFDMLPVRHVTGHQECVHLSMRQFPPEIITGVQITRLHIQGGTCVPPRELRMKDKDSPLFKTTIMGATLFMFKENIFLNCHLHIPSGSDSTNYGINWKERMFYSFLHELRRLRVPTEFHITVDGDLKEPELSYMTDGFMKVLKDTTSKLPPFLAPNQRCDFPTRETESEEVIVLASSCACDLCTLPSHLLTQEGCFEIFKGDISKITQPKTEHTFRDPALAMIASFTAVDEAEFDIPLDPLGLVDEEDFYKYMNTHPGCEEDDDTEQETPPSKPPAKLTDDPIRLIERNPPPGIPDTFVPGNWRDFLNISSIEAPEHIQREAEKLLDRYTNILSCRKTDCRPIYIDGKPVEVDVQLSTDKPIFIKPYPIADRMSKVLDAKIDEMLDKDEIVEVDSPYNIPILLTHHNSENKHIAFEDRKFRLCLDLRAVNSLIMLKNRDSHMVKHIEHLYGRVQNCDVFTVADMTKAYRSLPAAWHLRQICAFRTPDSTKYPFHVWAFRSTPDGLAILPGFYSLCLQKCLSARSRSCVIQHIDDLLISSKGFERHLEDLESVFSDLLKGNFLISMPKLKLFKKQVSFLGHVLDGKTLDIPKERRSYFDALKPPTTKKEMQSLLGVAGYMAHFVDSYHLKTGPLFESLKGKGDKQSFTLNTEQMLAFEELKTSIKAAEQLHIVDFDKPIYMEVDASLTGTGSVLYQEYRDPGDPDDAPMKRRIIRYGSRRFSITESLHHTSLEREAMGILIGCKTHFYYLSNCVEAIIKTDLKSLITLLSCYNNPDSARFARISHRLYSLPFKWSLIHVAGVDLPLADALSRLHPPYRCAFSDRHHRYPDLKREYIQLPEEWKKTPNLVLTTSDIVKAMRDKIVFVDKTSPGVRRKRLDALVNELHILQEDLGSQYDTLSEQIHSELQHIELSAKEHQQQNEQFKTYTTRPKKKAMKGDENDDEDLDQADIFALEIPKKMSSVSAKVLITPAFISKHQNEDPQLSSIILHLKTTPKGQLKSKLVKTYRLLNDTILCTRKNKRFPFHAPGNLRIVCSTRMTLIIMSILHIMGGHYGINTLARLFAITYKTKGSITGFAKIVALGCRACRLHRPTNKRNIPMGRIPIPSEPNHTWHMDHVIWKKECVLIKGKRYEGALNIVDLYSNLLISHLVPDVKAETTIECLKQTFSIMPAPLKIVSDNATGLCSNLQVATFLKSKGVQNISTITPYNSKGNKTERMNKILRETLQLVRETFRRRTPYEMYSTVIEMINSRPLSLTNHPHIRQLIKDSKDVVTPFSLHYGQKPQLGPLVALEDELDPRTKNDYRLKWQRILAEHDRLLQQELDEKNKTFNEKEGIQVGDLVLKINRGDHQHKENIKYTRNLYEVIEIQKSKFTIRPLFTSSTGTIKVNGQDLKPYNYSELFDLLPPDIRDLMGESLKPDDLKNQATNDASKVPRDFQNWGLVRIPPGMKLRNKLTPSSLASVPAITMSNSNTITDTRTTLTFSSDDGYSEHSRGPSSSGSGSFHGAAFFKQNHQKVNPMVAQPKPKPLAPRRQRSPSLEDESLSEHTEVPQLKTTEDGVTLVKRKLVSYLPPPDPKRTFPLGRSKPLPPPGLRQARRHHFSQTPSLASDDSIQNTIPILETIPLPSRLATKFITSTPNPSLHSSEENEDKVNTPQSEHSEHFSSEQGDDETLKPDDVSHISPLPVDSPYSSMDDPTFESAKETQTDEEKKESRDSLFSEATPPSIEWDFGFTNLIGKEKEKETKQKQESPVEPSPVEQELTSFTENVDKTEVTNILDTSPPPGWNSSLVLPPTLSQLFTPTVEKAPLENLYKITADITLSSSNNGSQDSRQYAGEEDLNPSLPFDLINELTTYDKTRKQKAIFADHHGLPLIEDNEGMRWRPTRRYEKDKTQPKHVPFSAPPTPDSSESAQSLPDSKTKTPPVTTRTGRIVKKPTMFGEWETNPSPHFGDTPEKESHKGKEKESTPVRSDSQTMSPSRLTGFHWSPDANEFLNLSGMEHPKFQTPSFSRFDPSKLKEAFKPKTKITDKMTGFPQQQQKTQPSPPTPHGDPVESRKPAKTQDQTQTQKGPLKARGLLRTPVENSPKQHQKQQGFPTPHPLPPDIQLGDSPPPRRTARNRKPPRRFGFED